MSDLSEFLLARIAEDEQAAREPADEFCSQGYEPEHRIGLTWTASIAKQGNMEGGLIVGEGGPLWDDEGSVTLDMPPAAARHVARWDPARVLAECDAKRRIVEQYRIYADAEYPDYSGGYCSASEDAMAVLALPYAEHPDYRQEWKP